MNIHEKDEIGQFIPIEYHFQLLSNKERVTAFEQAIKSFKFK